MKLKYWLCRNYKPVLLDYVLESKIVKKARCSRCNKEFQKDYVEVVWDIDTNYNLLSCVDCMTEYELYIRSADSVPCWKDRNVPFDR